MRKIKLKKKKQNYIFYKQKKIYKKQLSKDILLSLTAGFKSFENKHVKKS
jgi:hypothetical protein